MNTRIDERIMPNEFIYHLIPCKNWFVNADSILMAIQKKMLPINVRIKFLKIKTSLFGENRPCKHIKHPCYNCSDGISLVDDVEPS